VNPDNAIGYVDSCARFWFQVYDSVNGGFYTNVDRQGKVITSWGTNKNLLNQSRDAYGFTRAFMLTGDEKFLTMARHALDFMYQHAWDPTYGGWYNDIDNFGNPISPGTAKTAFYQHYALVGPAASVEATQDTLDWRWLKQGYASSEANLWDTRASFMGYFDASTPSWSSRSDKSFNATVDAITTHVLSLYLLTGDETYKTRLLQLADNMLEHLVGSMDQQVIGFVEGFTTDWTWDNNSANYNTRTIMGHVLKTAWCFGRIHQLFPDSVFVAAAEKLTEDVLSKGYDHALGGPYKDYDRVNGSMFMYGQADTAKAWWQMEQAVTDGLMLYEITGKDKYLQMADETLNFFMTYFVDHVYGEVYSDRTRSGGQIWGDQKGDGSKAAYHSTELGYYVYLYGNLMLLHKPVTLHYKFMADTTTRLIPMNPVAYASPKYRIKEVRLNGNPYVNLDAEARTLTLPPGVGGHFTVTYEPVTGAAVADRGSVPVSIELYQNYPNPFNPKTFVSFQLPVVSEVRLVVYDLLGREVALLVNETKAPGSYRVAFDGSKLSSGVYVYTLSAGNTVRSRTMVLLR
jgi:mannose/cellobiose epimerase-like protein (N-acyl-D-glucosamine 2-epimerase family)